MARGLVIFDFDGTLADSFPFFLRVFNQLADEHGFHAVWLPERHFNSFGALFPNPSVLAVMAPVWLYALGHGIHMPCGQTGAVGPFPRAAGRASALRLA